MDSNFTTALLAFAVVFIVLALMIRSFIRFLKDGKQNQVEKYDVGPRTAATTASRPTSATRPAEQPAAPQQSEEQRTVKLRPRTIVTGAPAPAPAPTEPAAPAAAPAAPAPAPTPAPAEVKPVEVKPTVETPSPEVPMPEPAKAEAPKQEPAVTEAAKPEPAAAESNVEEPKKNEEDRSKINGIEAVLSKYLDSDNK